MYQNNSEYLLVSVPWSQIDWHGRHSEGRVVVGGGCLHENFMPSSSNATIKQYSENIENRNDMEAH